MYPTDYPQLPNRTQDAKVGMKVRYGESGPYEITRIVGDSIWIKYLADGKEFEMVRAFPKERVN